MKNILISILLIFPIILNAQYSGSKSNTGVIKITPTNFILGIGTIGGELPLSKKISTQLGFSALANETTFWNRTLNAKIKGYFITPEIRYYVKGEVPKGFYMSIWARYGDFKARTTTNAIAFDIANYKILGFGGVLGFQSFIRINGINIFVLDVYFGAGYYKFNYQARFHQHGRLVPDEITMLLPRFGISLGFGI